MADTTKLTKTVTVIAAMLVNTPVCAVQEMNVSILFGFLLTVSRITRE